MDVMELRRGLLMQMASGGFMDGIFEEIMRFHVEQTTTNVIVPINELLPTGYYTLVALPLITAQDGIDANTYVFMAGGFVVSHFDHRMTAGPSAIFNELGSPDFWGLNVSYVDTSTKDELSIKCGNGQVSFVGNHDLCFIRVKSD